MKIYDMFGCKNDESKLELIYASDDNTDNREVFLNEEHAVRLLDGEKPLHTFLCSPAELGELCAGWLISEGYSADCVNISEDGTTAEVSGCRKTCTELQPEKNISCCDADTSEMLALFSLASDKYARSHGLHECVIKSADRHIIRTDIGRHNAIDKAIGAAMLQGIDIRGAVMFTSGRINEQTVKKAVRCGIGCLMSKAVITRQALELSRELGLKVFFSVKKEGHYSNCVHA